MTGDLEARARAWRHGAHTAVCDVLAPWAHGTVLRATRFPDYYAFNLVRVERDPGMSAAALAAFADRALAGLAHRRLDFDVIEPADALRAAFTTAGWEAQRLVWMHMGPERPAAHDDGVEEVPYDAVHELRLTWTREGAPEPGDEDPRFFAQAREVALLRGVRVIALREQGRLVGFAQLERAGEGAEITQVFVHPQARGGGRGTALTSAAIRAAGDVRDLWICADDEGRPKRLYARLGFRPAATTMEITRPPGAATSSA